MVNSDKKHEFRRVHPLKNGFISLYASDLGLPVYIYIRRELTSILNRQPSYSCLDKNYRHIAV